MAGHEETTKAQREGSSIAVPINIVEEERVGGQCQTPVTLSPGKRPGTHWTGGWMCLGVCLIRNMYINKVMSVCDIMIFWTTDGIFSI